MPKSPLEAFFDKIFDAVDDAAAELVRDAGKQAKENMRRISRQLDQAATANSPVRPATSGRKRAQERSKPVGRPERPPTPQITLYTVLEVSPRASIETIAAAFRSLSTRFHPDTGKVRNDTRYKEITAAWNVLKNAERRKAYDRSIGL
jgi:DnaJ-domain-containing protein 1